MRESAMRSAMRGGRSRAGRASLGAALAAGLAFSGCARHEEPPPADPESARTLPAGRVLGFTGRHGSHVWLGIPYAKPPVGGLRWLAPRPLAPFAGERTALVPGSICPQYPTRIGGVPGDPDVMVGDEDCLTLDVYAPRRAPERLPDERGRWPVMVWIHGGGNVAGHSGFYDGGRLAQEHEVLVVIPQYRLGPLGWLRHASLRASAETPEEASGNFGTLDLVRALEWVRENAAALGGDPDRVTIFGESAGGRNVMTLVLAKRARGLFHRAISQSGSIETIPPDRAENRIDDPLPGLPGSSGELVLRALARGGTVTDRATARRKADAMRHDETAKLLRDLDAPTLLSLYRGPGGDRVPTVFADGALLAAGDPYAALRDPEGPANVPLMLGTNRDEHKTMLFGDRRYVQNWLGLYPRVREPELHQATSDAFSRLWKVRGADEPASALTAAGRRAYVYRFDWDEQGSVLGADLSRIFGAGHGMEIPFVFGHFDLGPQSSFLFGETNAPGREQLTRAMMSYWVEFARVGDPGTGVRRDLPPWLPWTPGAREPKMMLLDTAAGGGVRMSSDTLTAEAVVAAVLGDARLGSLEARCAVLGEMAERYSRMQLVASECPELPAVAASPPSTPSAEGQE